MNPRYPDQKGIALLLVLWILALLSVIVGEFCYAMRTEVNITHNFKQQTQAYYVALAGLNRAIEELVKNEWIPPKERMSSEDGETVEGEDEKRGHPWRFNVDIPAVMFGPGKFKIRIGNESGKININGAKRPLLEMMVDTLDLDPQQKDVIVDSILDWRDENSLHRLNGAEDDYYNALPEPYGCKDGDFDSVEELLFVRGITPEIFYGGLRDLVTTLKPPNKRIKVRRGIKIVRADLNKININAAPIEVLRVLPLMTEILVQEIINYRKDADFRSPNEVADLIGPEVYKAISPYISTKPSPFFSVVSKGTVDGGEIQQGVEATIEVNRKLKKGYRVVRWRDRLDPSWGRFSE